MCWRWRCDRINRSEGTWSGNLASCTAGDISAAGRANALRMVNLYRFLGGLSAVTADATKERRGAEVRADGARQRDALAHAADHLEVLLQRRRDGRWT